MLECQPLKMPKFGNEDTGYDGSKHWKVLHDEVESIGCEYCKQKGVKLIRGIHDSVNAHIGKPVLFPDDLRFTFYHLLWSMQKTSEPELKCSLC